MKNNPFSKHDIDHLSAHTINTFIANPAMCLMKLSGYKSQAGASAWRGSAVDVAITDALTKKYTDSEIARKRANVTFDFCLKEYKGKDQDQKKIDKERSNAQKIVSKSFEKFIPEYQKQELIGSQGLVEIEIEDIAVPFIGYYDLLYQDKVVDLKTKAVRVSKVETAHKRQLSIYAKATGKQPVVVYLTPNEITEYSLGDLSSHLENIRTASLALEKVLSFSDDILECCRLFYPDLDHWIWGEEDQKHAKTIWSIR